MAESSSSMQQAEEIFSYLVNNLDKNIEIFVVKKDQEAWSKSLKELPLFTIKEIEHYRLKSGKNQHSIIKTRDRGRKFKEERYLTSGDIYTKANKNTITIKGKCKASMKKEFRNMNVIIDRKTSKVIKGHCTCPAGNSGYCNHTMALLFELADYSLQQLKVIPQEVSCTSKKRVWGVPTDKQKYALPVLSTKVTGDKRKGVSTTLYDPRLYSNKEQSSTIQRIKNLKQSLKAKDLRIGFAHILSVEPTPKTIATKYGDFIVGSPLSYQLSLFDANFTIICHSIFENNDHHYYCSTHECIDIDLPLNQIMETHQSFPTDWGILNYTEMMVLNSIFPETIDKSRELERLTIGQYQNKLWLKERSKRITSSQANKVYTRRRNFETLADSFNVVKKFPKFVQEALDYGNTYEKVAKQKFFDYMTYRLKKNVFIRETGLVVQPYLFWLGASPDGLLIDSSCNEPALIEIKCPYTKRNLSPSELLKDEKFYVLEKDGVTYLRKDHQFGYFTQVQLAMGLAQVNYCFFIVYTYKGLLITKVPFDEIYFIDLVKKLNHFYKKYFMKTL